MHYIKIKGVNTKISNSPNEPGQFIIGLYGILEIFPGIENIQNTTAIFIARSFISKLTNNSGVYVLYSEY